MKLKELSEVEILIMKSIWKLGDDITAYDIIEYLKGPLWSWLCKKHSKNLYSKTKRQRFSKHRSKRKLQLYHSDHFWGRIPWGTDEKDERFLARWFGQGNVPDTDKDDHTRGERRITGFNWWFGLI